MLISIVVAVAQNGVIGYQNNMPWHLPNDLRYFKRITLGHTIIMGRRTFESIGRPLPKRTNIVVSRQAPPQILPQGVYWVASLQEALQLAVQHKEDEVFVIGGGQIYIQALPLANRLYITLIEAMPEGDTFFALPTHSHWEKITDEPHLADAEHHYNYRFTVWERLPEKAPF